MLTALQAAQAAKDLQNAKQAFADGDPPAARALLDGVHDLLMAEARRELRTRGDDPGAVRRTVWRLRERLAAQREAAVLAGDTAARDAVDEALAAITDPTPPP